MLRAGGGREVSHAVVAACRSVFDRVYVLAPDSSYVRDLPKGVDSQVIAGRAISRELKTGLKVLKAIMGRGDYLFMGIGNRKPFLSPSRTTAVIIQNDLLLKGPREISMLHSPTSFGKALRWWATERSIRKCDLVFSVASHLLLRPWFESRRATGKATEVVQNGVDASWLALGSVSDERTHRESYFVYPSQFVEYKNQVGLVRSIALARTRNVETKLVLVGQALSAKYFRSVREIAGSVGAVTVIDKPLPRPEFQELLRSSSGIIYPSLAEASPVAVLEAQSTSLPLALSAIPAHRELARSNDLLFDASSVEETCQALEWLRGADRESMIPNEIRTWAQVSDQYAEALAAWLSRHPRI